MKEQIPFKIWVIKFCLGILYPNLNSTAFLVFLIVKNRVLHERKVKSDKNMNKFKLRSIPFNCMWNFLQDRSENEKEVLFHKCIVIPKESFIQLCADNLFYVDNGVLWAALKLAAEFKAEVVKTRHNEKSLLKCSIHLMPSEIHKRLWNDTVTSTDSVRIVPVVGSKYIQDGTALVAENEYYNIASTYKLTDSDNIEISFNAMPAIEYAPKIAATADVNLVVNEHDLEPDLLKVVLSNHFAEPKLVSANDIFSIPLNMGTTGKYHYSNQKLIKSVGKLYFKCNKLSSDVNVDEQKKATVKTNNVLQTFFIIKGVTQLTLGENIHTQKPKDQYLEQTVRKRNPIMLHSCPTGLRQKFEQIQETISPFLYGDLSDLLAPLSTPIIPLLLLTGPEGSGKHLLVRTLASSNGLNCLQVDCNKMQTPTGSQTEVKIGLMVSGAKSAAPVIVLMDHFEVFAVDSENSENLRIIDYFTNSLTELYQNYTKHAIIFIAVTEKNELKPEISKLFLEKFHMPKLNLKQRGDTLKWFAAAMELNIDEEEKCLSEDGAILSTPSCETLNRHSVEVLDKVAAKTETFNYGDLDTLLHFALRESYLKQQSNHLQDPNLRLLKEEDFDSALGSIRKMQSQNLDAPKIPKVYWDDIGGLDALKKELLKTIEFPIKYPHLFKNSNLKRSGLLLYGPPGCGKTLVAKAVSTELKVSFLSVNGPELLNMYIGQSEENVRKMFECARASSPCIIFMDELDALAPRRGAAGDAGGAADRVVSQLLAELDGVGDDSDAANMVFIMGATNRPDLLDESLLRPGRLDKMVYVGPYCGEDEKLSVLTALCRSHKLHPDVDLRGVSCRLPRRATGADLMQVVAGARAAAVRTVVQRVDAGLIKESELSQDSVVLKAEDFEEGVQNFVPSVTDEELAHYESLQAII